MKKRITLHPLESMGAGRALFFCCFVLYAFVYCGRLNYSAALAEIVPGGLMEKDAAGLVSSAFFVTYGAGMFINGFLADRLQPFGLVCGCTFLAAASNLGMYFAVCADTLSLPLMVLIWGFNGYVQSSLWPTMIRIVSTALPERMRVGAGASMMATTAVGTTLSYLLSRQMIRAAGWRTLFLAPAILLAVSAILWLLLTRRAARKCCVTEEAMPQEKSPADHGNNRGNNHGNNRGDKAELFRLLRISGALAMICPIMVMAIVKDGITQWTPTMLTELFQVEAEFSVTVSTLIPFISIFGAALARFVMERWLRDETKASALFFFGAMGMLVIAATVGCGMLWIVLVTLAVSILFMLGINTLLISLVPLRFAKYGKTATVTGVLNSTAAVSCGVASYLAGLIAKHAGWQITILIWAGLCILGGLVCMLTVRRWKLFKNM